MQKTLISFLLILLPYTGSAMLIEEFYPEDIRLTRIYKNNTRNARSKNTTVQYIDATEISPKKGIHISIFLKEALYCFYKNKITEFGIREVTLLTEAFNKINNPKVGDFFVMLSAFLAIENYSGMVDIHKKRAKHLYEGDMETCERHLPSTEMAYLGLAYYKVEDYKKCARIFDSMFHRGQYISPSEKMLAWYANVIIGDMKNGLKFKKKFSEETIEKELAYA